MSDSVGKSILGILRNRGGGGGVVEFKIITKGWECES